MIEGVDAIALMLRLHPEASKFFGAHESAVMFAAALMRPGWRVLAKDGCWLMLEDDAFGGHELHWFCPSGASLPAVRSLLSEVFKTSREVWGKPPDDHPNRRAANVLARALGAKRIDGRYALSRADFMLYNAGKEGL